MENLHLNLIKVWFDMILSKEKKEEYREVKPYWCSRFLEYSGKSKSIKWWGYFFCWESDPIRCIKECIETGVITFKDFSSITFSNGYAKNRPQFDIKCKGIEVDYGVTEWGAVDHVKYFVLKLGNIFI